MARKYWLAGGLVAHNSMFVNIKGKITTYTAVLPLTASQEARILLICNIFSTVFEHVEATRQTMSALIEWRDDILRGSPAGQSAPAAPEFAVIDMPQFSFIGIMTEFIDLRDLIVELPGFTDSIGEDLMLLGEEFTPPSTPTLAPDMKVTVAAGYKVNIACSMKGMSAVKVEYQRNGTTTWVAVGFLIKMPGECTITPATPGQPESGRIRGTYIQGNDPVGLSSPEYPVTLS